jgi:hypothetical protein
MRAATQHRPAPQGPWPRNAPARSSLPGLAVCSALALGYAAPPLLIHSGLAASRVQSSASIPALGGALRLSRIRRRRPGRTWDALMCSLTTTTKACLIAAQRQRFLGELAPRCGGGRRWLLAQLGPPAAAPLKVSVLSS